MPGSHCPLGQFAILTTVSCSHMGWCLAWARELRSVYKKSYYCKKNCIFEFIFQYVIAVSCVINWAPQMVGFCSGIVAAGFGISSSIFAPIQVHICNNWLWIFLFDFFSTYSDSNCESAECCPNTGWIFQWRGFAVRSHFFYIFYWLSEFNILFLLQITVVVCQVCSFS